MPVKRFRAALAAAVPVLRRVPFPTVRLLVRENIGTALIGSVYRTINRCGQATDASSGRRARACEAVATMPRKSDIRQRVGEAEAAGEPWDRWRQILDSLPDVRSEKVRATREAIRRNGYDGAEVLEETIRRLSDDLDVLFRRCPSSHVD